MGVAAHMLEINKYRKYPGVQVTPAALESGGRPGDGLVNLIRKLGRNMNKTERAKFIDEAWATYQRSAPDWKRSSSHRIAQRHFVTPRVARIGNLVGQACQRVGLHSICLWLSREAFCEIGH